VVNSLTQKEQIELIEDIGRKYFRVVVGILREEEFRREYIVRSYDELMCKVINDKYLYKWHNHKCTHKCGIACPRSKIVFFHQKHFSKKGKRKLKKMGKKYMVVLNNIHNKENILTPILLKELYNDGFLFFSYGNIENIQISEISNLCGNVFSYDEFEEYSKKYKSNSLLVSKLGINRLTAAEQINLIEKIGKSYYRVKILLDWYDFEKDYVGVSYEDVVYKIINDIDLYKWHDVPDPWDFTDPPEKKFKIIFFHQVGYRHLVKYKSKRFNEKYSIIINNMRKKNNVLTPSLLEELYNDGFDVLGNYPISIKKKWDDVIEEIEITNLCGDVFNRENIDKNYEVVW